MVLLDSFRCVHKSEIYRVLYSAILIAGSLIFGKLSYKIPNCVVIQIEEALFDHGGLVNYTVFEPTDHRVADPTSLPNQLSRVV